MARFMYQWYVRIAGFLSKSLSRARLWLLRTFHFDRISALVVIFYVLFTVGLCLWLSSMGITADEAAKSLHLR